MLTRGNNNGRTNTHQEIRKSAGPQEPYLLYQTPQVQNLKQLTTRFLRNRNYWILIKKILFKRIVLFAKTLTRHSNEF